MKNVHGGTKKSGRKSLMGAEFDSWVFKKFERRKKTQWSRNLKKSRTKKSGRKFLLGTEYDSWVLKFERRKNTAVQEIKKVQNQKN